VILNNKVGTDYPISVQSCSNSVPSVFQLLTNQWAMSLITHVLSDMV